MLILSRRVNESIVINGNITVRVLRITSDAVKLGITAPADVRVFREELYQEIQQSSESADDKRSRPKKDRQK